MLRENVSCCLNDDLAVEQMGAFVGTVGVVMFDVIATLTSTNQMTTRLSKL